MTEADQSGFRLHARGRDITEIATTLRQLGATIQEWEWPASVPADEGVYVVVPPDDNAAAKAIREAVERWDAETPAEGS